VFCAVKTGLEIDWCFSDSHSWVHNCLTFSAKDGAILKVSGVAERIVLLVPEGNGLFGRDRTEVSEGEDTRRDHVTTTVDRKIFDVLNTL
jgi:hypothetical protein